MRSRQSELADDLLPWALRAEALLRRRFGPSTSVRIVLGDKGDRAGHLAEKRVRGAVTIVYRVGKVRFRSAYRYGSNGSIHCIDAGYDLYTRDMREWIVEGGVENVENLAALEGHPLVRKDGTKRRIGGMGRR
jgi:hypothetical protein